MNFRHALKASLLALLLVVLGTIPALAQVPTGSIVGTVVDAQKATVEGAQVTITSQDTGVKYSTMTASNGEYAVQSLPFGLYRVDVSKDGFKLASVKDLKLDASSQLSVPPIALEVGARSETVTVEANAAAQVQTTDASVTTHIDTEQLNELPVASRQPAGMITLEPGVVDNGKTGDGPVVDGQRTAFTNVTLDGINIQDNFIRINDTTYSPNQLFLSQTGEFAINTQNGDASVGGGASAVSVVTPRGTNTWHGSGFWYYQSNKWAANPWFNNAFGIPNSALNQNQYGGTVGGPVIKNKLFVYGSFEELKDLGSTLENATIFTPSATGANPSFKYATDCNNQAGPGGIPCPGGVTPGQVITVPNFLALENSTRGNPVFTVDPAMAALIARIPANATINNFNVGDSTSGALLNTGGFSFDSRDDVTLKNTGVRADYTPTAHQSFSVTYYWNRQIFDRPDIDQSFDTVPIVSNFDATNFFSTAWRWSPTANFTNEVRFGFDLAPATFNTSQVFGPSYISGEAFTSPDPNFFFQGRDTHTWAYEDNANLLHGNHSLSFGMQLQRVTIDSVGDNLISEDQQLGFSAANPYTLTNSDFSAPISSTSLSDANSLLATYAGFVGTTEQTFNVTSQSSGFVPGAGNERNYRQNDWAFYANDAWRFRKNLTITYGLRYEYLSPFSEANGLMLQPIPGVGESMEQTLLSNATVGFVGGSSGRRPYNKDLHDFGPNIGIAWDPFGDGKTAIRAGYTIHYVNDDLATVINDAVTANAGLSSTVENPNVSATVSGDNNLPMVSGLATPTFQIPTTFEQNFNNLGGAAANAGFGISPDLRTPYVQDWNLSVQRAIGWNTTVTVSYLGNHSTDLIRGLDINQVIINQNGLLTGFNVARNNCFASIAANQGCNPLFTGAGSQSFAGTIFDPASTTPLPGCTNNPLTSDCGFLNAGVVESDVETGQVGSLADLYHVDGIEAFPGQFTPNEFIRGGDLMTNFSSSSYNAGVVQVQRRFSHDLIFQGSYTFSKVMDDADGSQTNFSPLLDNANPQVERARASFDVTNAFKANFVYNLPFGQGQRFGSNNGVLGRVIGGWSVSSILLWQSGSPYSFYTGTAGSSGLGTVNRSGRSGNETAILGMGESQIKSAMHLSFPTSGPFAGEVLMIDPSFIDPNSGLGFTNFGTTCQPIVANGFCNPQPGQLGNLARNEFNGPMFFNEDLSILKTIPIRERVSLRLRGDAFNVFNHPTFVVGDQNINSSGFGQVDSTVGGSSGTGARVLQIGATLIF